MMQHDMMQYDIMKYEQTRGKDRVNGAYRRE